MNGRPRRILLVEDNLALLAALGKSLRDLDYDVTSTCSGADAVCLLQSRQPPDLVLLDLVMPGVDGYGVLSTLGAASPPVIIMTGEMITVEELASCKVLRVLSKPFQLHDLQEALRSVLKGIEEREQAELPDAPAPAPEPPAD